MQKSVERVEKYINYYLPRSCTREYSHHSLLDRRVEAVIGTNLRANAAGAGRVQQIIGRAVRRIPAPSDTVNQSEVTKCNIYDSTEFVPFQK